MSNLKLVSSFLKIRFHNIGSLLLKTATTYAVYANNPILMTGGNAEAPIRIGELVVNDEVKENRVVNWSQVPKGYDLNVRMSGLVWPDDVSVFNK